MFVLFVLVFASACTKPMVEASVAESKPVFEDAVVQDSKPADENLAGSSEIKEAPMLKPLKITRVEFRRSSVDTTKVGYPPKGPGQTYVLDAQNYPEFDSLISSVLDETKLNNAVTLREFIELRRSGNTEEAERIEAIVPRQQEPKGSSSSSSLALYDGDEKVYTFDKSFSRYSGQRVSELYSATTNEKNLVPTNTPDLP